RHLRDRGRRRQPGHQPAGPTRHWHALIPGASARHSGDLRLDRGRGRHRRPAHHDRGLHRRIRVTGRKRFRVLHGYLGKKSKEERRSEEHTSELQSLAYLVCRLLLEKKKKKKKIRSKTKN